MECKYEWQSRRGDSCRELIDTLWNVNKAASVAITAGAEELIDTLWNVNPNLSAFRFIKNLN